jgi:hypothetical protein
MPMPGDAVRIKKPARGWWAVSEAMLKDGEIGIIEGIIGVSSHEYAITFNCAGSAFRGPTSKYSRDQREIVSCSGGPGSFSTPTNQLLPTDESIEFWFWRWKDIPRGNGGVHYSLLIPLWSWEPHE